jgi:ribosomal RNA assembly protein
MEYEQYTSIPKERVGALVGNNGVVKRRIEQETDVKLRVNSDTGEISIARNKDTPAGNVLKTIDIINAIGAGFPPKKALQLFADDIYLVILNITDYIGKERKDLVRQRARIIGLNGKARKMLEQLTETDISVSDRQIAIIGQAENNELAKTGIEMLLSGTPHGDVYKQLKKSYIF